MYLLVGLCLLFSIIRMFFWMKKYRVHLSETNVGYLVSEVLSVQGIKAVYTLIGGHVSPIIVGCKNLGIRVIDVRHEASAVFAADAHARLDGSVGVAIVTAGPGVTNTLTALQNAQMAQTPLLLIGGSAPTLLKGRGALQDIDQYNGVKAYCKRVFQCTSTRDLVPFTQKALLLAKQYPRGPVFVEYPVDLLYSNLEVLANMGFYRRVLKKSLPIDIDLSIIVVPDRKTKNVKQYLEAKKSFQPIFVKQNKLPWFLKAYFTYQIVRMYGGLSLRSPSPINLGQVRTLDSKLVKRKMMRINSCLQNAKRPLILMGSQAVFSEVEARIIAQHAVNLGIPMFLGGMARGILGKDHPLHIRQGRSPALKQADLVLLLGIEIDFRLDYGKKLPKSAKIICIHPDASVATKNTDVFWKPYMSMSNVNIADIFVDIKRPEPCSPAWLSTLHTFQNERINQISRQIGVARHRKNPDLNAIHPLQLAFALDQVIEPTALVIGDGGDYVATVANVLKGRGPMRWLDPGVFGTLGVGGGFAIGASQVLPNTPIWLMWGDGSSGYSLAEIDTLARHGMPIIAVIGNDAGWTQIERDQVALLEDNVACPLEYTAYHKVAEGYGGIGMEISYLEGEEVIPYIAKELEKAKDVRDRTGKSVVINVLMGCSTFREGSISM